MLRVGSLNESWGAISADLNGVLPLEFVWKWWGHVVIETDWGPVLDIVALQLVWSCGPQVRCVDVLSIQLSKEVVLTLDLSFSHEGEAVLRVEIVLLVGPWSHWAWCGVDFGSTSLTAEAASWSKEDVVPAIALECHWCLDSAILTDGDCLFSGGVEVVFVKLLNNDCVIVTPCVINQVASLIFWIDKDCEVTWSSYSEGGSRGLGDEWTLRGLTCGNCEH